jgi:alanyl-tRNA synthetase
MNNAKERLRSDIVVGTAGDGKVTLVVGVTKNVTERISVGTLVGKIAAMTACKGGKSGE